MSLSEWYHTLHARSLLPNKVLVHEHLKAMVGFSREMKTVNTLWPLALVLMLCSSCENESSSVGVSQVSPDQKYVASFKELPGFDRSFQVLVAGNNSTSLPKIVYTSPDEGRPVGTERFIWTTNSEAFLLVGSHFFTRTNLKTKNGQSIYLFYNVVSGELRSNASQNVLPGIDAAELRKLFWREEVF